MLGQSSLLRWSAPEGPWTEPDLHLFPQDGQRYEIVDGSLHVTPPQDGPHVTMVKSLIGTLRAAAPDGWWVCDRLGVAVGNSNLIPDVTVLRPQSSGTVWLDPADVALVIEVETPASRRYDRLLKPSVYADAGIPAYWRVEPDHGMPALHLYTLTADGYHLRSTILGPDPVHLDDPFPLHLAPDDLVSSGRRNT